MKNSFRKILDTIKENPAAACVGTALVALANFVVKLHEENPTMAFVLGSALFSSFFSLAIKMTHTGSSAQASKEAIDGGFLLFALSTYTYAMMQDLAAPRYIYEPNNGAANAANEPDINNLDAPRVRM